MLTKLKIKDMLNIENNNQKNAEKKEHMKLDFSIIILKYQYL